MPVVTFRLKHTLAQKLESLAMSTGRTKTFYLTKALEDRLEEYTETYQPIPSAFKKEPARVKRAITQGRLLRFKKPVGMTLQGMLKER